MNIPQTDIQGSKMQKAVAKWRKVLDYSSNSIPAIQNEHVYKTTAMLLENQEQWCFQESNTPHHASSGRGRRCFQESNVASTGGVFGATTAIGNGIANSDSYATGDARLPKILIPMIRRTFPELISNEIVGVQPMGGPVGLAFALRYAYQGDTLSDGGIDGKAGGGAGSSFGSQLKAAYTGTDGLGAIGSDNSDELGFQLLDTRFTGTSSAFLSGHAEWTFADQDRGIAELLSNYELTGKIPQIELKFDKTAVEAGTRRLATRWSVELEQDIKNMNGIDIDGELTNAMSYEIQAEIDREVVMRMIQTAFNAGSGAGFSIWSPVSADGRWTAERNITFYQRLLIESGRMAARNRRGAANFVIAFGASLKCFLTSKFLKSMELFPRLV